VASNIIPDDFAGVTGIYALIDPTDNTVGYVGKSKDIAQRYAQHLDGVGNDRKSAWIADLSDQDLRPEVRLLEKCGLDVMDAREDYWLTFYLDAGEAIYNESKKVKCSRVAKAEAGKRLGARLDGATSALFDAIVFLSGVTTTGTGGGVSQTLETLIWQHVADHHLDNYDLFKIMLRKRGVDFNAELAKRT
jgi:hypothetical protein